MLSKFNPRNITYIPAVKFIERLDLEQNISLMNELSIIFLGRLSDENDEIENEDVRLNEVKFIERLDLDQNLSLMCGLNFTPFLWAALVDENDGEKKNRSGW